MKLAEALIERAELQQKNAQLLHRITGNTLVQEGDSPAEEPAELIAEYEENMVRLQLLIQKINAANSTAPFDEKETVADAIARRDCLGAKLKAYRSIYDSAAIRQERYSQKEVKFVRAIDLKKVQDTINRLSKEYRETDTRLQSINWTTELGE